MILSPIKLILNIWKISLICNLRFRKFLEILQRH
nr:MAG TPA: hypothetical protein [Crassvirales sp.]